MLTQLKIKNFILLRDITIDFREGLTVITGETGAGKSLLIDALRCFLQKRINNEFIINNDDTTQIIAIFDLKNNLKALDFCKKNFIEVDNDLIILKKIFSAAGKAKNLINDEPITVKTLNQLAELLIEIHGQFDNNYLFDAHKHIDFIDELITNKAELNQLAQNYSDYSNIVTRAQNAEQRKNLLAVKIKELEEFLHDFANINLTNNYYEELLIKQNQLKKELDLASFYREIDKYFAGDNSVTDHLLSLQRYLQRNQDKDEHKIPALVDKVEQQLIIADQILQEISGNKIDLEEKEQIDQEISDIKQLARKYNIPANELAAELQQAKIELQKSQAELKDFATLNTIMAEARANYLNLAEKIAQERADIVKKIEELVISNLHDLDMRKALFKIKINDLEDSKWSKKGIKSYEFYIKTNLDQPFEKLNKIASGGELSRFMIALKIALNIEAKTMIFDEIDSGISGKAAHLVAVKLKEISQKNQIFVITHQAQVAAASDNHLKVIKKFCNDTTISHTKILSKHEKIEEVATMISGQEITEEAILAAKKLL